MTTPPPDAHEGLRANNPQRRARHQFRKDGRFATPRTTIPNELWEKLYKKVAERIPPAQRPGVKILPILRLAGPSAAAALIAAGAHQALADELADTTVIFTRDGKLFVYIPHERGRRLREIAPVARQVADMEHLLDEVKDTEKGFIQAREHIPWPLVKQKRTIQEAVTEAKAGLAAQTSETVFLQGPDSIGAEDELLARKTLRGLEKTVSHLPEAAGGNLFIIGLDDQMMLDPTLTHEAVPGMGTLQINPAQIRALPPLIE